MPDSTFIMWRARRFHDRLKSQEGLLGFHITFNAFDIQVDLLDYFLDVEKNTGVNFLAKITIPVQAKQNILSELHSKRIDEYSIYGGPDNLGLRVSRSRKCMLADLE